MALHGRLHPRQHEKADHRTTRDLPIDTRILQVKLALHIFLSLFMLFVIQ